MFLFAVWIIALDARAGVGDMQRSLEEMALSYGATPAQLYGKIILWAALPEILAGIRIGFIRGVKGVVIGQLLVSVIGYGEMFELYSRNFLMAEFWALTILLFAFAMLVAEAVGVDRETRRVLCRSETVNAISEVELRLPAGSDPGPAGRRLGQVFPVRRLYCVGRNYAEHAIEMGHDPNREPPFFFQKNPDSLRHQRRSSRIRAQARDVHFEIELVVALQSGGSDIPVEKAMDCVFGYAVGLDMTRRDLQGEAKKLGRPWEVGKVLRGVRALRPDRARRAEIGHPAKGAVWLDVNGKRRQTGDLVAAHLERCRRRSPTSPACSPSPRATSS